MRKLFGAAALLIAAIGGVLAWHYLAKPQAPPFAVGFRVGEGRERTIAGAMPLVFTVFVSKSAAPGQTTIGAADDPWYAHLVIESVDAPDARPLHWSLLGRPRALYIQHEGRENLTSLQMYDGPEAVFDQARKVYIAELGVAPEQVASLSPGRHSFRAVLASHSWLPWRWRGRATSAPVAVVVERASVKTGSQEDATRLAESSRFYFRAHRFDEALRTAQSLVQASPDVASYHLLLADALNGLRRDKDAYDEYQQALLLLSQEQHHGHHDSPEYLFARMREVHERMTQAPPTKK